MAEQKKLDWSPLDMANAKGKVAKAWAEYGKAREAMTKAREALETELKAELVARKLVPDGKVPLFSYRFGVAVAFDAPSGKTKSTTAKIVM